MGTAAHVPVDDPSGWGRWMLNEDKSFPLAIRAPSEKAFLELANVLTSNAAIHSPEKDVAQCLAETGIWCEEIEKYVEEYRPQWERSPSEEEIKKYVAEWGEDWEDFVELDEPELDVVPYCDLSALFGGRRLSPQQSRDLARLFGLDQLRFYVRNAAEPGMPVFVKQGHRDQKRYDQLVRFGLASLRGPAQRKKKVGLEFEFSIPPLKLRLDQIQTWLDYCDTRAFLIMHTYRMAAPIHEEPAILEILKGYEVSTVGDGCVCAYCQTFGGKYYSVESVPRPPFHVGCRCSLLEVFK